MIREQAREMSFVHQTFTMKLTMNINKALYPFLILASLCMFDCKCHTNFKRIPKQPTSPKVPTSSPTTNPLLKACEELSNSDILGCVSLNAAKEPCAYSYSDKRCIKAPNRIYWPGQSISAGGNYACAVDTDGDIRCWKENGAYAKTLKD